MQLATSNNMYNLQLCYKATIFINGFCYFHDHRVKYMTLYYRTRAMNDSYYNYEMHL